MHSSASALTVPIARIGAQVSLAKLLSGRRTDALFDRRQRNSRQALLASKHALENTLLPENVSTTIRPTPCSPLRFLFGCAALPEVSSLTLPAPCQRSPTLELRLR